MDHTQEYCSTRFKNKMHLKLIGTQQTDICGHFFFMKLWANAHPVVIHHSCKQLLFLPDFWLIIFLFAFLLMLIVSKEDGTIKWSSDRWRTLKLRVELIWIRIERVQCQGHAGLALWPTDYPTGSSHCYTTWLRVACRKYYVTHVPCVHCILSQMNEC